MFKVSRRTQRGEFPDVFGVPWTPGKRMYLTGTDQTREGGARRPNDTGQKRGESCRRSRGVMTPRCPAPSWHCLTGRGESYITFHAPCFRVCCREKVKAEKKEKRLTSMKNMLILKLILDVKQAQAQIAFPFPSPML